MRPGSTKQKLEVSPRQRTGSDEGPGGRTSVWRVSSWVSVRLSSCSWYLR